MSAEVKDVFMKVFEIKGFKGFVLFLLTSVVMLSLMIFLPVSFCWVTWNAVVGEIFHGPMISFWQAILLTAIVGLALYIVFQPEISFQFKRVESSDELDKKKLK
jgi:hypothetical protein